MGGSLFVISVIFNVLKLCRQTSKMIGYSIRTGGNNTEDLQKIYPLSLDIFFVDLPFYYLQSV